MCDDEAMATFNVFVEGPVDESPTGLPDLADAMSRRYGLSAEDLVARLKRGRFRVKSNLDEATAERYRQDLAAIGARALVEDSTMSPTATPVAGTPVVRPSGAAPAASASTGRGATPTSGLAAAGPAFHRPSTPIPTRPAQRPSTPIPTTGPAHQRPSTPIPSDVVSGLSAGFGDAAQADLGALSDGSLSLASLDGEEAPAASNQFDTAPSIEEKPAVTFAPSAKTEPAPRNKPPSKAMDLFAPPDAGDQDFAVDLATEEVEERAAKKASAPAEASSPPPSASSPPPAMRRTPASMGAVEDPVHGTTVSATQFSRGHFIAGVVLALVIGFIPAHFVAAKRETSAFAAIDQRIEAAHAAADSTETYLALDGARTKLREDKQGTRTMIALTSMLLWAVISAGVGFAFFRFGPKPKA